MSRNTTRAKQMLIETYVGALVVLVFFGIAFFSVFLREDTLFAEKYPFEVVFADVYGLREGDNTVMRGVKIGKVREMRLEADGVHVVAILDRPVALREDFAITVVASSILGGSLLRIDEGSPDKPLRTFASGEFPLGITPYDIVNESSIVVRELRESLTEGDILGNLSEAIANLRDVSVKLKDGSGTVGALINDRTVFEDLRATVTNLKTVSDKLASGKGVIGRLLSEDEALYTNLVGAVSSLRTVAGRLEQGQGFIGKLLAEDDTLYTNLSATVASLQSITAGLEEGRGTMGKLLREERLHEDLRGALQSLRVVVGRLEEGEGTVGKLMRDDELYEDVKQLLDEARATVDDFRETSPIVTFSSIFFGAF